MPKVFMEIVPYWLLVVKPAICIHIHVCSPPFRPIPGAFFFCQILQWSMFNLQTSEDEGNEFNIYTHILGSTNNDDVISLKIYMILIRLD